MGNLAECQKPYTQKVNGNFGLHKMPLLKNGFLEKIETGHVGSSCQYTHFMSFSSKSEHDTVADQATLSHGLTVHILQRFLFFISLV